MSVATPKTERGKTTMNRIIKAAEVEFGRRGYHNTSINDIATRAKVAPGTIYIYFEDKYSLYCHILQQYGHKIRKNIAKHIEGLTDRLQIERAGLLAFLKHVKNNPHMYNIIWESLYINPELFVNYYEGFAARYKAQLDLASSELVEMDTTVLAYVLMGISNFVGLKYVFFDKEADLERVVDEVMKLLQYGMLRQPNPQ
ncbi:MAG: TetR/AcrR family transcriptional regulator [Clostridiales bacterium]|nr:TetR/AcrR family transcriptional regulator [Clostridiales bacterium]